MSAHHFVKEATRTDSMSSRMPLVERCPFYTDRYRYRKWRWGAKKGLRRARRRVNTVIVILGDW